MDSIMDSTDSTMDPELALKVTGRVRVSRGERWYEARRTEGVTWTELGRRASRSNTVVRETARAWALGRGKPWPLLNRSETLVQERVVAFEALSLSRLWVELLTEEFRSQCVDDTERWLRGQGLSLDAEDIVQSALADIIQSGVRPDGRQYPPWSIVRTWVRRKVYSYVRNKGTEPLFRARGCESPHEGWFSEQVSMPELVDGSQARERLAVDVYRVCSEALRAEMDTPQGRVGAQERLPRVLGLMLCGWSVAEMGEMEGVSRNRMARMVVQIRGILRDRDVWIASELPGALSEMGR